MNTNDIIVSLKFDYVTNSFNGWLKKKTIQRFPLIENESDVELKERVYKWLEEKGYKREGICDLRLIYEGSI
jgi:phosphoribosylformimino-5-aminoimidazole carboxamide ribonucleotide (ProFAR) isomerase